MTFINAIAGALVGGITKALAWMPDWLVLTIHAWIIALIALGAYALVSNQKAIKRIKNRLTARLLEIRLFQDSPLTVLSAFAKVLGSTVIYLKNSLMPMFVMLPIAVLWITHLAGWFEWRPLKPGESALVTVKVKEGTDIMTLPNSLQEIPGIQVTTPAFRSAATDEVQWRIQAKETGQGDMKVEAGGVSANKAIATGDFFTEVAPRKLSPISGFWDRVMYPMEAPLASDSAIEEIRIDYPQRTLHIFGFQVHWMIWLLVASILLGFVCKKPFGVEF